MTNTHAPQLEMRWIPVDDADGRTRMEAVWIMPEQLASVGHSHAA